MHATSSHFACVTTDELPIPANLKCTEVPHGLLVTWDVVTNGNYSCARRSIVYVITVVGEVNRTVISVNGVEQTYAEITGSLLEPSQNYTVYIGLGLFRAHVRAEKQLL